MMGGVVTTISERSIYRFHQIVDKKIRFSIFGYNSTRKDIIVHIPNDERQEKRPLIDYNNINFRLNTIEEKIYEPDESNGFLNVLPDEITYLIILNLDEPESIAKFMTLNKLCYNISHRDSLWKNLLLERGWMPHLKLGERDYERDYEEIWTEEVQSYREIYMKKLFYRRCIDEPSLEVHNHRTWKEFARYLLPAKCQYGIFRTAQDKIALIIWIPETASVRDKMIAASSKDLFKKRFDNITLEYLASDYYGLAAIFGEKS